ncbi:MAG: acetate--CoA ligase family protein [Candidatus Aminicenantales bacterium]
MGMKFTNIDKIFEKAEKENRRFLFEHEVYRMLKEAGLQTPKFVFLPRGKKAAAKSLAGFRSPELVLKIVSPLIVHKSDVGGVQLARRSASSVNKAVKKMLETVPRRFQAWTGQYEMSARKEKITLSDIERSIRGILILEKVEFEKIGFGTELLLGVRNSREFGPVVTLGAGGLEVEYLNERLKEGKAASIASAHLLEKKDVLAGLEPLAVYDKLVNPFRGKEAVLPKEELRETYFRFRELAAHYSPFKSGRRFVIEEAEVNPFVIRRKKLVPLDGTCRFSRQHVNIKGRPVGEIQYLLHPRTIAVIGVSERMNLGHIILTNILKQGFPRENVFVVKPGLKEIEGCVCIPSVSELPVVVDLFVLTLSAEQSYDVMRELLAHEKARSVIIIAGGIGEKKGTQALEESIVNLLAENRRRGRLTPAVNGGNCMGIYSRPGKYDTTFIPEYKLRWPRSEKPSLVYISQSGAFMASRVSQSPYIEPLYGISLGNQIDLRVSDYLNFLKNKDNAKVFAVYLEGFKAGDGFALAEAAATILKQEGKAIVIYKGGRSPEGKMATSSHTASVADDYSVCRAVLEGIGVIVAENIFEFESFVKGLIHLADKKVRGNRVGLISNAGFESVIMADNLKSKEQLELADFAEKTKKRLSVILSPLGIDRLQDIKNPLDLTPVADDEVFAGCVEAVLADDNVDCAVVSPVPMTPAMQTLAPGEGHVESIDHPESVSSRLMGIYRKSEKPFVVNVDAGAVYNPMVERLEKAGVPTFRYCDAAVKFLRKYVHSRLRIRIK